MNLQGPYDPSEAEELSKQFCYYKSQNLIVFTVHQKSEFFPVLPTKIVEAIKRNLVYLRNPYDSNYQESIDEDSPDQDIRKCGIIWLVDPVCHDRFISVLDRQERMNREFIQLLVLHEFHADFGMKTPLKMRPWYTNSLIWEMSDLIRERKEEFRHVNHIPKEKLIMHTFSIFADYYTFEPNSLPFLFPYFTPLKNWENILIRDARLKKIYERFPRLKPGVKSGNSKHISNQDNGSIEERSDFHSEVKKEFNLNRNSLSEKELYEKIDDIIVKMFTCSLLHEIETELVKKKWQSILLHFYKPMDSARQHYQEALRNHLQKCIELSSLPVYRLDLSEWIRQRFKGHVYRKLAYHGLLRIPFHLRAIINNLFHLDLPVEVIEELVKEFKLLYHAQEETIAQLLSPLIDSIFADAHFHSDNTVETIAMEKIKKELLAVVLGKGYFQLSDLRDLIAKNDLKLKDFRLKQIIWERDTLLACDHLLKKRLYGIYHGAEIYMRLLHRFSGMLFGTALGRLLTLWLFLPFGGAYLFLEAVFHLKEAGLGLIHYLDREMIHLARDQSAPESFKKAEASLQDKNLANNKGEPQINQKDNQESVQNKADNQKKSIENSSSDKNNKSITEEKKKNQETTTGVANSRDNSQTRSIQVQSTSSPDKIKEGVSDTQILIVGFIFLWMIHFPNIAKRIGNRLQRLITFLIWKILFLLFESRWTMIFHKLVTYPLALAILGGFLVRQVGFAPDICQIVRWVVGIAFLIFNITPIGSLVQLWLHRTILEFFYTVSFNFVSNFLGGILEVIHWVVMQIEKGLGWIDRRFLLQKPPQGLKLIILVTSGTIWSIFRYFIRFALNLLIEPQINPIKHFPVVTVSHKLLLPMIPNIAATYHLSTKTTATIVSGIPGIFGFLVWELNSNWKLFEKNRNRKITPTIMGSHGESLSRLMIPSIHSGTIPKLWKKVRKAIYKKDYRKAAQRMHELDHIREKIEENIHFHFLSYLQTSKRWSKYPIQLAVVKLTPCTINLTFDVGPNDEPIELWLNNDFRALTAYWIDVKPLRQLNPNQWAAFHDALRGLYSYLGIQIIKINLTSQNYYKREDKLISQHSTSNGSLDQERDSMNKYGITQPQGEDFADRSISSLNNYIFSSRVPSDYREEIEPVPESFISPCAYENWVERWQKDEKGETNLAMLLPYPHLPIND